MFKNFNHRVIITVVLLLTTVITCCCVLLIPKFAKNTTAKENKKTITSVEKETSTLVTKNDVSTESTTNEATSKEESDSQIEESEEVQTEYVANEQNYNENNSVEKTNYTDSETQKPEPQPEPTPVPTPDPEPQPEVVEDYIVYKSDGSIDLNESYWVTVKSAHTSISQSKEYQDYKIRCCEEYGYNNVRFTAQCMNPDNKIVVNSFIYHCKVYNTGELITYYFDGNNFVKK